MLTKPLILTILKIENLINREGVGIIGDRIMAQKIMVVDDEPNLIELVKAVLESEGYEIITATSGQECLEEV